MVTGVPVEFRDRRDWDEIRAWAAGIASVLRGAGEQQNGEETEAGRERT